VTDIREYWQVKNRAKGDGDEGYQAPLPWCPSFGLNERYILDEYRG